MEKTKSNQKLFNRFTSRFGTLLILIAIMIVLSIANSNFLTVKNIMNILRQVSVTGVIGLGMTLVIVTSGIDLSAGSVLAFSGMLVASLAQNNQPVVAVIVGLAVGTACGLINGLVISLTGIPPFIMTLGMQLCARGAANLVTGGYPISGLNESFKVIGGGHIFGFIPVPVVIYAVLAVISFLVLQKTAFGKRVYAIGCNEGAAHLCGVNVKKIKILVYTYIGLMTGAAAVMITSRVNAGNASVGLNFEFDAITGAVVGGTSLSGGTGSIIGTVIGCLIVGCLDNGLTLLGVSAYYQQIFKGVLIVASVIMDTYKNKVAQRA